MRRGMWGVALPFRRIFFPLNVKCRGDASSFVVTLFSEREVIFFQLFLCFVPMVPQA